MGTEPPLELNDDVTAEILLRVAPDNPAHLSRASHVCKLWHRIVSDPGFLRRYCTFHRRRATLLLGFFYNLDFPGPFSGSGFDFPAPFARFVATTAASPLVQRHNDRRRRVSWALDCRHGRVLFKMANSSRGLAVWDPIADDWTDLPPPGIHYSSYSAVVLCDVAGCDHHDCHAGPFLVACIGCDASGIVYACVYSSEDRAWRAPVSDGTRWCLCRFDVMMRPAIIRDGIYCIVDCGSWILKYDLVKRRFSSIKMPKIIAETSRYEGRDPVLMQNEDGSLGIACVRGSSSRLHLWSRSQNNTAEEGYDAARWVQRRFIKLEKLLPLDNKHSLEANVIGFAEGVGVFFVRTNAGVFTVDLRWRRVMKVSHPGKEYRSVVPFMSFFTPGDCAA